MNKKKKPKDLNAISNAYFKKYEEFNKLSLDELKALYEDSTKDKKKRIGGIHRTAFLDVVSIKLQNNSIRDAVTTVEEPAQAIKNNENINNETIIEPQKEETSNGF